MPKTSKTYQALEQELEQVLSALQHPDVRVDEAVQLYEQGIALVGELEMRLKQAENKLEKLKLQAPGKSGLAS